MRARKLAGQKPGDLPTPDDQHVGLLERLESLTERERRRGHVGMSRRCFPANPTRAGNGRLEQWSKVGTEQLVIPRKLHRPPHLSGNFVLAHDLRLKPAGHAEEVADGGFATSCLDVGSGKRIQPKQVIVRLGHGLRRVGAPQVQLGSGAGAYHYALVDRGNASEKLESQTLGMSLERHGLAYLDGAALMLNPNDRKLHVSAPRPKLPRAEAFKHLSLAARPFGQSQRRSNVVSENRP